MTESRTRRCQVTFETSLPMGTVGRFTLDGERWIALPQAKYTRILTIIDLMLGQNARIRTELVRWINHWPDDAARVAGVLEMVGRVEELSSEVITEKTEANAL